LNRITILAILLAFILVANATYASAATLWDLIIKAEFEQSAIGLNESPVIFGTVLNQASKPVSGAEIKIRFGGSSVVTTTDSQGNFRYEFEPQTHQGTFSVSISAKLNNWKGFATTTLKVGDEVSTFNEIYYKSQMAEAKADKDSLAGDPYKALKLSHYQKFIEEQNKIKQKQINIESKKVELSEKRDIAKQKLEEALKERPIGAGIYTGDEYERYLEKLDPRIKSTISYQLNYTKRIFEEAQYAMKSVLDNGGSAQEARKAYLEKLSTTKEQIIKVGDYNNTESHSKIKTAQDAKINSKKVKGLTLNKNLK
jgi:hypothetical protein